jgi:hypothetical protein
MRYGTATVRKIEEADPLAVTVSVAVERPEHPESSYMRCRDDQAPGYCRAGALSGVRYARHAVDRDRFGIEVQEVRGSLDHPAAGEGAAMAAMFAVWLAWGYRWTEAEAQLAMGWSLSESADS